MTTYTIYSDSSDGNIISPASATWSTARDATTGASVDDSSDSLFASGVKLSSDVDGVYTVTRSFFTFDTSVISETVINKASCNETSNKSQSVKINSFLQH